MSRPLLRLARSAERSPIRILWHSNAPFVASGYGQQTNLATTRIRDAGHEVSISAFYGLEGATLEWEGMTVYPSDHTRFGKAMLPFYVGHVAGDDMDPRDVLVITLMDVWVLNDHVNNLRELRMASWVPVDHEPVPLPVVQFFQNSGATPIAMSRFGEEQLRLSGLDPLYVPHAIDTNIFKPLPDREAIREGMGIPEGAFVVGMVANNQGNSPPRKAFPQVFQAFAEFRKRHSDAFLYLHADVHGAFAGLKLQYLAELCGIPAAAFGCSDQLLYKIGLPMGAMPYVYATFDVMANPSFGEGFGIPIVEAQACGVPVVVTDWTAMTELCGSGWLVDGDRWYDTHQGSWFKNPSVAGILEAFEEAYTLRGDESLGAKAREFAVGYDANKVFAEFWLPALEALDKPREVEPLVPLPRNRAERRAAAKAGVL